jgi:hypothetical protein
LDELTTGYRIAFGLAVFLAAIKIASTQLEAAVYLAIAKQYGRAMNRFGVACTCFVMCAFLLAPTVRFVNRIELSVAVPIVQQPSQKPKGIAL